MRIFQATLKDIDAIAPLFDAYRVFYKQASDEELARKFLTERLAKKDSVIFLCEVESKIVGFTQLYPVFSSVTCQKDFILNDLYVDEDKRGKGVAKALLLYAQLYTKAQGFKGLALETQSDNRARFLYEKLGWQKATNLHYSWTAS
jgi:GNAT superfamily N-acetyltransferase